MGETAAEKPLRDERGRLLPGQRSLNQTGLAPKQLRQLRALQGLTDKAIRTLERLLDDANPSAALGAAKEVLDRTHGKVRQNVTVDVQHTSVLHLQALQELADRRRSQLLEAQATVIVHDATIDGIGLHGDSTLALSAADYSVSMGDGEPPRPPDPAGAAAYAPTTLATLQKSQTEQDDTP